MASVYVAFNPRKPAPGELVKVTLVMRHPMDHGLSDQGVRNPNYIYDLQLTLGGEELASFVLEGSISPDPLISFEMFAPETSTELTVAYVDHDGARVDHSVPLPVAS